VVRIELMEERGQQEKTLSRLPIQKAMTPPGADPSDTVWELLQGTGVMASMGEDEEGIMEADALSLEGLTRCGDW